VSAVDRNGQRGLSEASRFSQRVKKEENDDDAKTLRGAFNKST
jgi:hypothetical protein